MSTASFLELVEFSYRHCFSTVGGCSPWKPDADMNLDRLTMLICMLKYTGHKQQRMMMDASQVKWSQNVQLHEKSLAFRVEGVPNLYSEYFVVCLITRDHTNFLRFAIADRNTRKNQCSY